MLNSLLPFILPSVSVFFPAFIQSLLAAVADTFVSFYIFVQVWFFQRICEVDFLFQKKLLNLFSFLGRPQLTRIFWPSFFLIFCLSFIFSLSTESSRRSWIMNKEINQENVARGWGGIHTGSAAKF